MLLSFLMFRKKKVALKLFSFSSEKHFQHTLKFISPSLVSTLGKKHYFRAKCLSEEICSGSYRGLIKELIKTKTSQSSSGQKRLKTFSSL